MVRPTRPPPQRPAVRAGAAPRARALIARRPPPARANVHASPQTSIILITRTHTHTIHHTPYIRAIDLHRNRACRAPARAYIHAYIRTAVRRLYRSTHACMFVKKRPVRRRAVPHAALPERPFEPPCPSLPSCLPEPVLSESVCQTSSPPAKQTWLLAPTPPHGASPTRTYIYLHKLSNY